MRISDWSSDVCSSDLALVNAEGSPLAGLADVVIPLSAGVERSVAATKSYIASLAAIAALVAAWAEDDALEAALTALPGQLEQAFALDWSLAVAAFRGATNLDRKSTRLNSSH